MRTAHPKQKEPIWIKLPSPFFSHHQVESKILQQAFHRVAACINIDGNQSYIKQQMAKEKSISYLWNLKM